MAKGARAGDEPAWTDPDGVELTPLRPAAARQARRRRAAPEEAAPAPVAPTLPPPPAHDLSVEVLDHLSVLSDLVITSTDRSAEHLRAVADHVAALDASVRTLVSLVRHLEHRLERAEDPGRTAAAEARLADLVVERLQAAFRVADRR